MSIQNLYLTFFTWAPSSATMRPIFEKYMFGQHSYRCYAKITQIGRLYLLQSLQSCDRYQWAWFTIFHPDWLRLAFEVCRITPFSIKWLKSWTQCAVSVKVCTHIPTRPINKYHFNFFTSASRWRYNRPTLVFPYNSTDRCTIWYVPYTTWELRKKPLPCLFHICLL